MSGTSAGMPTGPEIAGLAAGRGDDLGFARPAPRARGPGSLPILTSLPV